MKETAVTIVGLFLIFNTVTSSKVLLISMDGFRWDYIQNFSTPNFDEFARNGVTSKYLTSPFITKTFPCHYTIATGKLANLYKDSALNNCWCRHTLKIGLACNLLPNKPCFLVPLVQVF